MSARNSSIATGAQMLPPPRWKIPGSTRFSVASFGLVLLLALVTVAIQMAKDPTRFPVTQVDVLGTIDYADRASLMRLIKQSTATGFYGLNLDELRQRLEAEQWVAQARVSRVWPSTISIEVEEHEPAARWNDDHLISKRLVLYKPHQLAGDDDEFELWSNVFSSLPQVLGAPGRHVTLLDAYRAYDEQLSRFNLSLTVLEEDDRLSQTLTLSNGSVVRLGLEQRELRFNRFMDVYERVAANAAGNALSFDMRYSNGFSLGVINPNEILIGG